MPHKTRKAICKKCGIEFSHNNNPKTRAFCSKKCYLDWQRGENGTWYGKKHTQSTKDKIAASRIGIYTGENHPSWKGGISTDSEGYMHIHSPNHPNKDCRNQMREHRLVMEEHLGRYLEKEEIVHHEDRDKKNNKIDNLKLFKNQSEHKKYHELMELRKILEEKNG